MLKIKIFNKVISVDKKCGKFVINAEFKESEHPRDKDGKFTDGSGSSGGGKAKEDVKKLNIKDVKILQETNHSYQIELPNSGSYWIKKSKVDKDGNLNVDLNSQKTEQPTQKKEKEKSKEETGILTYSKTAPDGYELKVSDLIKKEIEKIKEQQDSGLGANMQGDDIEEFAIKQYKKDRIRDLENADNIYDLTYGNFEDLDDANDEIEENPGNNYFNNRTEPFKSKEEAIDFVKKMQIKDEEDREYSISELNLDEGDWDKIRDSFQNATDRNNFLNDYTDTVSTILEDNGFYVSQDKSRISDSKYINVYKSEKDSVDGQEPLAKVRISDHDTHRFYGHHINLYTTENVYKEINKLLRSFANADFGVKETVYNKAIEVL